MLEKKRIALVAHDNRKADLIEWVRFNKLKLRKHEISCTGTTASNRATADFVISSHIFNEDYKPKLKDYSEYLNRNIK
jgi:methylglyoxal synthase